MKTRLLVIVVMLVSLAVPSCTSPSPQPTKTIQVSMDDVDNQKVINRDATLAVGDTLEVTLYSNQTTPLRWTADTKIGDPTIVQQTSHEYVQPSNPRGLSGGGGTEVWTFKALKAGITTIATDYLTSDSPTPYCSFTAKVTVQ